MYHPSTLIPLSLDGSFILMPFTFLRPKSLEVNSTCPGIITILSALFPFSALEKLPIPFCLLLRELLVSRPTKLFYSPYSSRAK
nr:MAG TPA: hypothetical protein [Caudoviricetes sp.]